jgi:hypothetical protein
MLGGTGQFVRSWVALVGVFSHGASDDVVEFRWYSRP